MWFYAPSLCSGIGGLDIWVQAAVAVRELLRRSGVKIHREHPVVEETPVG